MPGPQTVQVDVGILRDPIRLGNPNDFELRSGIVSDRELNFRNNGHPGFIVIFEIVDVPGGPAGFRFAEDPNQALWAKPIVAPGDNCPNGQSSWTQFEPQSVTGNGRRLIVRNRNEFTQRFGFVLNVTTDPAGVANLQAIDPIGNNQNGPQ